MGYGGYFTLINATPYLWTQIYQHSYEMNTWDFPTQVKPGQAARVYTELAEEFFLNSDDAAEVNYTINSPGSNGHTAFQISFQNRHEPTGFAITFGDIKVQDHGAGNRVELGFEHNNDIQLAISGKESGYGYSTLYPFLNWMTVNLDRIGCNSLREITVPGSHDAGMSEWNPHTGAASQENIQTQDSNILGQLQAGVRWFDIRPVIAGNSYRTGHYSEVAGVYQGGDGQTFTDIIDELNNFTAHKYHNELIVLDLSHSGNTDTAYRSFNSSEWLGLLNQMKGINHRYVAPSGTKDLTSIPLSSIIKSSPAVIIVLRESVDLSNFVNQGFYPGSVFPLNSQYSDTDSLSTLSQDQTTKLTTDRKKPSSQAFLFWWTLTQKWYEVGVIWTSIHALADQIYPALYRTVWANITANTYPNIIAVDFVRKDGGVTSLAMAINNYYSPKCPNASKRMIPVPFEG